MSSARETSEWRYFRAFIAFFVSPLVVPVILGLYADNSELASVSEVIKYFPLFSLLTYSVAAVIGGPTYILFRELRIKSLWSYSLAGLAIGLLIFVLVQIFLYAGHADVGLGVAFAVSGSLATTLFWLIAEWNPRPGGGRALYRS